MPRTPNHPSLPPQQMSNSAEWKRIAANWMRSANQGRLNCTGTVTLAANAFSTTVEDQRVGISSFIDFVPQTANAAAELASGGMYVSGMTSHRFTITHASSAQDDRTFTYTIMG